MSCEGCIKNAKQLEEALSTVKLKAKMYAIEHKTSVYLYPDSEGLPRFMAEEPAKENGIQPILGIITHYSPRK